MDKLDIAEEYLKNLESMQIRDSAAPASSAFAPFQATLASLGLDNHLQVSDVKPQNLNINTISSTSTTINTHLLPTPAHLPDVASLPQFVPKLEIQGITPVNVVPPKAARRRSQPQQKPPPTTLPTYSAMAHSNTLQNKGNKYCFGFHKN